MATRSPGLLLAVLALLVQVWLGAAAPIVPAAEFTALCSGAADAGHGAGKPGQPSHDLDCTLCPACATLAHHAPLLPVAPGLPAPAIVLAAGLVWPAPASAGPHRVSSAQARAPPVLA